MAEDSSKRPTLEEVSAIFDPEAPLEEGIRRVVYAFPEADADYLIALLRRCVDRRFDEVWGIVTGMDVPDNDTLQ